MSRQPCKCCEDKRPGPNIGANGYGFNPLDGEARDWAKSNRFYSSEHCVRVKDGKKFGGPLWIKKKCGDGTMGFSTRRKGQEDSSMERGLDGQWKKKRSTLVKTKSSRSVSSRKARRIDGSVIRVACRAEVSVSMRSPALVAEQRKLDKKAKRSQNRNNRARRGR